MIDKIFPRLLSSAKDARIQSSEEMMDALNVNVSDGFGGDFVNDNTSESEGSGDAGVIKPALGNIDARPLQDTFSTLRASRRIIGSVSDTRNNIVYFFVFSTEISEHGVYAVDQYGKYFTPNETGGRFNLHKVFSTKHFSFDSNSFVKGDIVFNNNNPQGILYFTDDINEPRKLNVKRCVEGDVPVDDVDVIDFITACPKTPVYPPQATFGFDPSRTSNDFEAVEGYQFAYQCLYKDGEESAISTYSDLHYPTAYATQGKLKQPQLQSSNLCKIRVRKFGPTPEGVPVYTREIEKIRLLGRIGNSGDFKIIEEKEVDGDNDTIFFFFNDEVLTAIPKEDELKQFDSLPRVAKAQTVSGDRLMYGNYVEGFDDVGDVSATTTITPLYQDLPAAADDAIDITVTPIMLSKGESPNAFVDGVNSNLISQRARQQMVDKVAGYDITVTSNLDEIQPNSVLEFSMTIMPDGNRIDLYKARNSFHSTSNLGLNDSTSSDLTRDEDCYVYGNDGGRPYHFQRNEGLCRAQDAVAPLWRTVGGDFANQNVEVVIGTSPSNCVSLPVLTPITFNCSLVFNTQIQGSGLIESTVTQALSAVLFDDFDNMPDGVATFGNFQNKDVNAWNLDLPENGGTRESTQDVTKYINTAAAKTSAFSQQSTQSSFDILDADGTCAPCGFFVLNSGQSTFSLESPDDLLEFAPDLPSNKIVARLKIEQLEDIVTRTAFPFIAYQGTSYEGIDANSILSGNSRWHFYSPEFLISNDLGLPFTSQNNLYLFRNDVLNVDLFDSSTSLSGNFVERSRGQGYLDLQGLDLVNQFAYSLCDGELNAAKKRELPSIDLSSPPTSLESFSFRASAGAAFWYGIIYGSDFLAPTRVLTADSISEGVPVSAFNYKEMFAPDSTEALTSSYTSVFENNEVRTLSNPENFFNNFLSSDQGQFSTIETTNLSFAVILGSQSARFSSFKTNATHDFGIVYYDERGRSGFVNKLGKVFVEGYSDQERGAGGIGAVYMQIDIDHTPPDWARQYQIVYAQNSTVSEFVFYSAGNAFVPVGQEAAADGTIYVSLNYLQHNVPVSYAQAFGAVAKDGTKEFYKYTEGDRLRVHSYLPADDFRQFPNEIVFDIIGAEILTDDPKSNPLVSEDAAKVHPSKVGQFIKLRNTSDQVNSSGFNFQSVRASQVGDDNPYDLSGNNLWRRRCVVELFSPTKKRDAESRVFYETGRVYNVVTDSNGDLIHQTPTVFLTEGDVYFRRVAVNFNRNTFDPFGLITTEINSEAEFGVEVIDPDGLGGIDVGGGGGPGLPTQTITIVETEEDASAPNFENFFLETETFTDMFSGADVYSIGKVKVISTDSGEIRRSSSIKYSDINNQASKFLRYTSFNDTKFPFKDMPNENGDINYILDQQDSLFVIQDDKCAAVPVDRNLLSDASGGTELISSNEVLGTPRFYSGNYGSDHPESVVEVDNDIYFASEANYEVYRFNPNNGIAVISDQGMRSYFEDLFTDIQQQRLILSSTGFRITTKVVSGYDPDNEEYLISVRNIPKLDAAYEDTVVLGEEIEDEIGDEIIEIPVDFEDADENTGDGIEDGEEDGEDEVDFEDEDENTGDGIEDDGDIFVPDDTDKDDTQKLVPTDLTVQEFIDGIPTLDSITSK